MNSKGSSISKRRNSGCMKFVIISVFMIYMTEVTFKLFTVAFYAFFFLWRYYSIVDKLRSRCLHFIQTIPFSVFSKCAKCKTYFYTKAWWWNPLFLSWMVYFLCSFNEGGFLLGVLWLCVASLKNTERNLDCIFNFTDYV